MQAEKSRRASLRERFDRLLAGPPQSDPLYLSNRTWKQKLKLAAIFVLPVLTVAVLVTAGSMRMFRLNRTAPYERPAVKMEAVAPKASEPKLETSGLEVLKITMIKDGGASVVSGVIRNNTPRRIASAEVSYYLSDGQGSLIGSESTNVHDIEARGTMPFRALVKMPNADTVMVRDVRIN